MRHSLPSFIEAQPMEDERLHLCTHLGVLGPLRSDGRRRCLRCGSSVLERVAIGAERHAAAPDHVMAAGPVNAQAQAAAPHFDYEAVQVAQTAEFDEFLDDLPTPLVKARDVG